MIMDNKYNCVDCNLNYKTLSGLRKHKIKYHNYENNKSENKKYLCECCNKSLSRSDNLKRHLETCKQKEKKDEIIKSTIEITIYNK